MHSVLGLVLVVVLSIVVSAQLPTSTLNDTVTDPQGAAVAGAKVSARMTITATRTSSSGTRCCRDCRRWWDKPTPHFVREQFGGSAGGPIKKDKAFWFVSTEYRNQGSAVEVGERDFTTSTVVDASAFLHDYLLDARTDIKVTSRDFSLCATRSTARGISRTAA